MQARDTAVLTAAALGLFPAAGAGQVNFGVPFEESVSVQFTTASLGGVRGESIDFRTIGGDFVMPVEFGIDAPAVLQLGGHYGFYSSDAGADLGNPILLDGTLNWDIAENLAEDPTARLLFTTGAEFIHVSEGGRSATRIELPGRLGVSYPVEVGEGEQVLSPGASLSVSIFHSTSSVGPSDTDLQFYLDLGATFQFSPSTGAFLNLRMDDERYGDNTRIQLGARFGL